jgi:hypothetical protein
LIYLLDLWYNNNMAKLKGPLMSLSASGTFGPRMTFSMRKGGAQVRIQKAQKDKITPARTKQRDFYKTAVSAWNALPSLEKQTYNDRAKSLTMTGYNLYLKEQLEILLIPNEPEVEAYITGLATTLSITEIGLLNTLTKSLKVGLGITNLANFFDLLYIRAGETAEQSLRNLAKRAHDSTAVNSPNFVSGEGYTGNGVSSYLNNNYIPIIDGVNYKLNSGSLGLYMRQFDRGLTKYNGVYSTTVEGGLANRMICGSLSGTQLNNSLNAGAVTILNSDTNGLYILNRVSATTLENFRNYVKIVTSSSIATKVPNQVLVELALRRESGGIANHNSSQISISFLAKNLTGQEHAVIVSAFESYMDSKGKGIIT